MPHWRNKICYYHFFIHAFIIQDRFSLLVIIMGGSSLYQKDNFMRQVPEGGRRDRRRDSNTRLPEQKDDFLRCQCQLQPSHSSIGPTGSLSTVVKRIAQLETWNKIEKIGYLLFLVINISCYTMPIVNKSFKADNTRLICWSIAGDSVWGASGQ